MEEKLETTIMSYMGGCQNHGPFSGYPTYSVPYYTRDPKRDHNFDSHPSNEDEHKSITEVAMQQEFL